MQNVKPMTQAGSSTGRRQTERPISLLTFPSQLPQLCIQRETPKSQEEGNRRAKIDFITRTSKPAVRRFHISSTKKGICCHQRRSYCSPLCWSLVLDSGDSRIHLYFFTIIILLLLISKTKSLHFPLHFFTTLNIIVFNIMVTKRSKLSSYF